MFRKLTESMLASPQIGLGEVAQAAALGVRLVINNRPEGESDDQTPGPEIEAAVRAAGMDYIAIPVTHAGFSEPQVNAMAEAISGAPGPVLAYCRSGTRSTLLWSLAEASRGGDPDTDRRHAGRAQRVTGPGAMALALQIGGSVAAVLLLTWLAHALGLGGDVRLRDEATARRLADNAITGFEPVSVTLDRGGIGALLRDAEGRVMLLRRHGVHFAARLLDSHTGVRLDRNFLTLSTDDRWFGAVTLDLGPAAQEWAGSFRRLGA